jgi:hypothetical protein
MGFRLSPSERFVKAGRMERGNVGTWKRKDWQVVQRSCDDPPFVGLVDADNLTRLVRWCAYGVN